ncbi:MAG: hypothetical protein Q7R67_02755 [bacterium]|nr:hypothetical protein [bacterium]
MIKYIFTTVLLFLIPIFYAQTGLLIDGMFLILYFIILAPLLPILVTRYNKNNGTSVDKSKITIFIFINIVGAAIYISWILLSLKPGF